MQVVQALWSSGKGSHFGRPFTKMCDLVSEQDFPRVLKHVLTKEKEKPESSWEKELTVKVKQAAVLATDKPFLVKCNGPSFMIEYE